VLCADSFRLCTRSLYIYHPMHILPYTCAISCALCEPEDDRRRVWNSDLGGKSATLAGIHMNLVIPAVAVWLRHDSLEKFAENKVKVKLPLHTCSLPLLPIYTTLYK
jgi:hypothetical protein